MRRLPPLAPDVMSEEQRDLERWFIDHRGGFAGPYPALLRVPALASAVSALGEQLRFSAVLPDDLLELVILVTVRKWRARFPWSVHSRLALKAGIRPGDVEAIAEVRVPAGVNPQQRAVYEFSDELVETGAVSDERYAAVVELLGEDGAVAVTTTVGFYGLVSLVVNVDRHPVPAGREPPFAGP
jgi:4-carboxymuconolactone decarboxylase